MYLTHLKMVQEGNEHFLYCAAFIFATFRSFKLFPDSLKTKEPLYGKSLRVKLLKNAVFIQREGGGLTVITADGAGSW